MTKTAVGFSLLRSGCCGSMSSGEEDGTGLHPCARRQSLLFPSLTLVVTLKNGGVAFAATQVSSLPLCLPTPLSLGGPAQSVIGAGLAL